MAEEYEDWHEDFADLIHRETDVDWGYLEINMGEMSTPELLEAMADLGLYVNQTLALEIAERDDAVFYLRRIIQDGKYWYQGGPGDAWTPIHAIHILPLTGKDEALDLLLDTIRWRGYDLDDWLTEDVPHLLVAFGEEAIPRVKEFTRDETLEPFVRGMATESLAVLARLHPTHEEDIKSHILELVHTTQDPTFLSLAADDLAFFHDPSVLPEIKERFTRLADTSFIKWEEIEEATKGVYKDVDRWEFERHTRDPLDHFSRENIERLHKISYAEKKKEPSRPKEPIIKGKKIGRNDPCPCGSGKKFKKCCLKAGKGVAS
jgi:uncharacterized protein YecA (UPF0149 family)